MRKKILLAGLSIAVILSMTACGAGKADTTSEETFPETEEESVEESEETESEIESEVETEEESEEETEEETIDPANRIYTTYPTFITEFSLEGDVLTVKSEDVGFDDYPIPDEMEFSFSYPVAENCEWVFDSNYDSHFESFAFLLEGVEFELNLFKSGESYYTKGEDFCKADNPFTFVVEDGIVVKVLSVEESVANAIVANEVSETEQKVETQAQTTTPTEETKPTATPAPVHEHSYTSSETSATCTSAGVRTYKCQCGDSYTESIPQLDHNWSPVYQTVHHESKGEMRQVQVGTSGTVYACGVCGAQYDTPGDVKSHCKTYLGVDNGHATSSTLVYDGQPLYENQWIVTQEAYDEQVIVGYSCSCGATK